MFKYFEVIAFVWITLGLNRIWADVGAQCGEGDIFGGCQLDMESYNKSTKIGDKYYMLEKDKANWFEALQNCRRQGAFLVAIETAAEFDELRNYLKANAYPHMWTSYNDMGEKDTYYSATSGRVGSQLKFALEQPDNKDNNEHCAHFSALPKHDFFLNDANCLQRLGYICEILSPKFISFLAW